MRSFGSDAAGPAWPPTIATWSSSVNVADRLPVPFGFVSSRSGVEGFAEPRLHPGRFRQRDLIAAGLADTVQKGQRFLF